MNVDSVPGDDGAIPSELEAQDHPQLLQTARRLLAEAQALSSRIAAVNEIATVINRSLHLDEILRVVGKQAKWLLDFEHCSVCLIADDGAWRLVTLFGAGVALGNADAESSSPLGCALQTKQAQMIQQGAAGTFLAAYASQMLLPLEVDRQILGSIHFATTAAHAYSTEDLRIAHLLALQVAAAIHNANRFQGINSLLQELNWLYAQLDEEKRKSEKLLLNTLPAAIAAELKQTGKVEPVYYESASVLFADFRGFTQLAHQLSPRALVDELDSYFSHFDQIIEKHHLEKLKTIGDCYMCAGGIPSPNPTHAIDATLAALEMQAFVQRRAEKISSGQMSWELRIGIHSGSLIAGVIGQKKFAYDVWGDTVNTAARMESSGVASGINISAATHKLIQALFACRYRGTLRLENQDPIPMYLVDGIRADLSADAARRVPNAVFEQRYQAVRSGGTTPRHCPAPPNAAAKRQLRAESQFGSPPTASEGSSLGSPRHSAANPIAG